MPLKIEHEQLRGFTRECPDCRGPGKGHSTGAATYSDVLEDWALEYRCDSCGETFEVYTEETAALARVVAEALGKRP